MSQELIGVLHEHLVPVLVFLGLAIFTVVSGIQKMVIGLSRERTRREIAAYVADGAMSPEQGERLMAAAPGDDSNSCA